MEIAVKKWSHQQNDFLLWAETGSGSCVLEAVAGSGKSTTILEAAKRMFGTSAMLAYNKQIANELSEKLKAMGIDWKKAEAGTVHRFGFKAFRKAFGDPKVDDNKVRDIVDALYADEELAPFSGAINKLVSMAKQRAIGFTTPIDNFAAWEDIWEHYDILGDFNEDSGREIPSQDIIFAAIKVLKVSNRDTKVIDYNDMVYLPLYHRVKFWQYDNVFVDEAQDTNPARRALVKALVKKGGRVIAVGDRHQAIYGFTGADNDSLDLIAKEFRAVRMPLSVTYRCPQAVVSFAKQWVSHIEAAPTAPQGAVREAKIGDVVTNRHLNSDDAILCRNTRPLIETAFKLIRNKIACKVEGRDIGAGLKLLAQRFKVKEIMTLEIRLIEYLEKETEKLKAKKLDAKIQTITDMVETLRVIISQCKIEGKKLVTDVTDWIDNLFADDVKGVLVLSTIHKSKGREWKNVYWLDRKNTCPSKYAKQAWEVEQEINLMYVCATRAMSTLYDVVVA